MRVKDVMTTNSILIPYNISFLQAAQLFVEHKISGAPVVDENSLLVGILSEKDLLHALYPSYREFYINPEAYLIDKQLEEAADNARHKTIKDIMNSRLITTTPDTHVLKVGGQMIASGIHRVPVIKERGSKEIVGIVGRHDIYKAVLEDTYHVHFFNNINNHHYV